MARVDYKNSKESKFMKNKSSNKALRRANATKMDEFYTQLTDIENELKHYKDQFRDKVVFCNCDDPKESNFVKYFSMNFEHLGLKKLTATHYKEADLFTNEPPYKLEYTGDNAAMIALAGFFNSQSKKSQELSWDSVDMDANLRLGE